MNIRWTLSVWMGSSFAENQAGDWLLPNELLSRLTEYHVGSPIVPKVRASIYALRAQISAFRPG